MSETPLTDAVLEHNVGYANYQLDELLPISRTLERTLHALARALEEIREGQKPEDYARWQATERRLTLIADTALAQYRALTDRRDV